MVIEAENVETYILENVLNGSNMQVTISMRQGARIVGMDLYSRSDLALSALIDCDIAGRGTELRTFVVVKGNKEDLLKETLKEMPGTAVGTVLLSRNLVARAYELAKVIVCLVSRQVLEEPPTQTPPPASAAA